MCPFILSKLVLTNFKSYAGVVTVGPFHEKFSSVVGPNGSGKSNLIDAILFVFGFRASKIRLKKISELIHQSNSASYGYCQVDVHFLEKNDGPPIEVKVSRVAKRSGDSYYLLNENKVSFKGVSDFLKSKGVDLENNRFLILQGEVEMISQMKPKGSKDGDIGLLEYLEDIIGTSIYNSSLYNLQLCLENSTHEQQSQLKVLQNLDKEVSLLQAENSEAEEAFELSLDLIYHKFCLNSVLLRQEVVAECKLKNSIEQFKIHKVTVNNDIEVIARGLKKTENLVCQKTDSLQKSQNKLVLERHILEDIRSNAVKTNEELLQMEKSHNELLLKQRTNQETLQQTIKQFDRIAEKTKTLQNGISTLVSQQLECSSQLCLLKQRASSCEVKTLAVKQKEKRPIQESRKLNLMDDNTRITLELGHLDQKVKESSKSIEIIQECIAEKQSLLEHRRLNMLQSDRTSLKALLEAQKCQILSGLHGRLGDLGSVPKKYDVAVSTACKCLNFVVVDSADDAQACVNYLRSNQLGRLTFIILEKLETVKPFNTVPGLRLFDFIETEEKFRSAFYFALKDTLVAESIEDAQKLAFGSQRFRVVTLHGSLIDISGAMTGGGGKVMHGAIKTIQQDPKPSTIDSIQLELDSLYAQLGHLELQKGISLQKKKNIYWRTIKVVFRNKKNQFYHFK
eukprot:TRINITY_DN1220_c0_g1_i6.p1 TRINITY_DN1220_c0_g1~~TRINITY_DN1220_c0_g1_i6.p1  ORF type:complete len:680 (+),score=83.28 TRINITY_DN1220_c0_g1_i6:45-2084(+)